METKPDGRFYSRILRKIKVIVQIIPKYGEMTLGELAKQINKNNLPEFYLKRFNRSMSEVRIKDYIRYLQNIKVLVLHEDKFISTFQERETDQEWAQAMSDRALEHLAEILKKRPDEIPDLLDDCRNKLLDSRRIPKLDIIIRHFEIEGGRSQELFRWSLHLYTDGPTCPFDIRHFPVLSITTK